MALRICKPNLNVVDREKAALVFCDPADRLNSAKFLSIQNNII